MGRKKQKNLRATTSPAPGTLKIRSGANVSASRLKLYQKRLTANKLPFGPPQLRGGRVLIRNWLVLTRKTSPPDTCDSRCYIRVAPSLNDVILGPVADPDLLVNLRGRMSVLLLRRQ